MRTQVRHENGVIIIEPHGKLDRDANIKDFRDSILPEIKADDQPASSSTSPTHGEWGLKG